MKSKPFIPKQNPDLPDSYCVKVSLITGKVSEYDAAAHKIITDCGVLEIVTSDDIWHIIPISSIETVSFDKNFSKVIAIKNEMASKK